MIDVADAREFVARSRLAIGFLLSCHQWDGLRWPEIMAWLGNFPPDPLSQYYPVRLLANLLYYSEYDLELLAGQSVNRIIGRSILAKQILSGFSIPNAELRRDYARNLSETLFIPLLVEGRPYESGHQIARLLVQRLRIPTSQMMNVWDIKMIGSRFKCLVVVDDCLGSGDELRKFWSGTKISDGATLLRDWCKANCIKAYYLTLIGYQNTARQLASEFHDLEVVCAETLTDQHRVFEPRSVYWDSEVELSQARTFFEDVATQRRLGLLGYGSLGFAVIMHVTVPDWSLPILWKEVPGWSVLMVRKNS